MEKRKREDIYTGYNKRFKPGNFSNNPIGEILNHNYFNNQRNNQLGLLNNPGLNYAPPLINSYNFNHLGINLYRNLNNFQPPGVPLIHHVNTNNNPPPSRGNFPNYQNWRELKSKRRRFRKKQKPFPSKDHDLPEINSGEIDEKTIMISDDSDVEFCDSIDNKLSEDVIVLDDDNDNNQSGSALPDNVINVEKDPDPALLKNHKTCDECLSDSHLVLSKCLDDFNGLICSDEFLKKECSDINSNALHTYCLICHTSIGGLCSFVAHVKGKNHKRELAKPKNKDQLMNIVFCKYCEKLILFGDDKNGSKKPTETLSSSIKNILLPSSGLRIQRNKPPTVNKVTNTVKNFHLLVQDLDEDFGMKEIFNELLRYCQNQEFYLDAIYFKPEIRVALVLFKKRKDCIIMESNSEFIRCKTVRATDSQINEFLKDLSKCIKWTEGDLSPLVGEIFNSKVKLENSIKKSLQLMNSASRMFDLLARNISQDLRSDLRWNYIIRSVEFFGSRVTGLSSSDSDFDIALLLDPLKNGYATKVENVANCLKKSSFFKVTRVIQFAKVPIVRLIHYKTDSKCDVSLNNLNGVYNSQLLRFYLDYDPRVKWIVVAVKMWACSNLMHGSFRFTSYALFWMVVYFLMQPKYSVVPTVSLLNSIPSGNRLICPGGSRSLCVDKNSVKNYHYGKFKRCQLNSLVLLKDFFMFYSTLDPTQGIDPYSGRRIHRKEIISRLTRCVQQKHSMNADKINFYTMILLDPISGDNICPNIRDEHVSLLRSLSKHTHQILSNYT